MSNTAVTINGVALGGVKSLTLSSQPVDPDTWAAASFYGPTAETLKIEVEDPALAVEQILQKQPGSTISSKLFKRLTAEVRRVQAAEAKVAELTADLEKLRAIGRDMVARPGVQIGHRDAGRRILSVFGEVFRLPKAAGTKFSAVIQGTTQRLDFETYTNGSKVVYLSPYGVHYGLEDIEEYFTDFKASE